MAKKTLEPLTETMFYVLMALRCLDRCGTEIAEDTQRLTLGRVRLGPGTLYTVLGVFEKEGMIRQVKEEGRKRTYRITEKGLALFASELNRLRLCVADAERSQEDGEVCQEDYPV